MNREPTDQDEQSRAKTLFEQSFGGVVSFLSTVALAAIILTLAFCHACPAAECKLAWDAPPASEIVTAWKVYRGIELLATTTKPEAVVTLPNDARSTLSVVACNSVGNSPPALLTVVPFTPRHSEDLRVWVAHPAKTIFIEAKPKMFANFAFPP